MCSSEAISCEFKLCSNLPTFQYARADHLFSQPSSPRFRLNLSSSCRRADRYNQSFRSFVHDDGARFWIFGILVPLFCLFPGGLGGYFLFPVTCSLSCGPGVCFLVVLVEVKVVNMEVKPLCLFPGGLGGYFLFLFLWFWCLFLVTVFWCLFSGGSEGGEYGG